MRRTGSFPRLDESGRQHLADLLVQRILSMFELLVTGHRQGTQPWARLWAEGLRNALVHAA